MYNIAGFAIELEGLSSMILVKFLEKGQHEDRLDYKNQQPIVNLSYCIKLVGIATYTCIYTHLITVPTGYAK